MQIAPSDPRIAAPGIVEWARDGAWWRPRRLPLSSGPPVDPGLAERAEMPAGARLDFVTDATALRVEIQVTRGIPTDWPVAGIDVLVDGELALRQRIEGRGAVRIAELPAGTKRVELWLPHFGLVSIGSVELSGAAFVRRPAATAPVFVTYGSSITQCKEAPFPLQTWPAMVASTNGWDLRCLGFGGQCHLDHVVATHIRDTAADLIHLCLGINIYAEASYPRRTLASAVAGFIDAVRSGHPDVPIVVTTPILSPSREDRPNATGMTLDDVRAEIARAVSRIRDSRADSRLTLVDGRSLIGPGDEHHLPDGLHPSPEGYRLLAQRISPVLMRALSELAVSSSAPPAPPRPPACSPARRRT